MKRILRMGIAMVSIVTPFTCDTTTPLIKLSSPAFEAIEHAAIHMLDENALMVVADTVLPGPHLGKEDVDHRLLKVTLPATGNRYCGYIHCGPDMCGHIVVCIDCEAAISVTNRSTQGDVPVGIERTFSAAELSDSTGTQSIKQAVLFEATPGATMLKIGPTAQSSVKMVIEEVEHED